MGGDDDIFPSCTAGCCIGWGALGGTVAFVLFILFGVFALVPAGPFETRDTTLGVVLVVLGGTGVASVGGYLACGIPCAGVGFILDKALDRSAIASRV